MKTNTEDKNSKISILNYRTTPHKTIGVAPCELLFNWQIRGKLPQLQTKRFVHKHRQAKQNVEKREDENKVYYDQK